MITPCPTCFPVECDLSDDQNLYSIQQSLFPFVLECPPGFDCNNATEFKIVCCNKLLSVTFPLNSTVDDRRTLIQGVLNQCAGVIDFCGDNNKPENPPPPPTTLFLNVDKTCSLACPDGSPFYFTIPAGTFAADTQAMADKMASDYACQQVSLRRVCMGQFNTCTCLGSVFSQTVTAVGGVPPIHYSINGGSLPPGLSLNTTTGLISGTTTLAGAYAFSIRATEVSGGFTVKTFTISVITITTTVLPAYTVGVPYSFQLAAAGGSGNFNWKITAGSLPPGLTMSLTGLISGTPT